jgi:hypothetical protein
MKHNRPWLIAMCVVGMGSVFILPVLGISLGSVASLSLILLCPLSHVNMMWGVFKARKIQVPDATVPARISTQAQRSLPSGDGKIQEG